MTEKPKLKERHVYWICLYCGKVYFTKEDRDLCECVIKRVNSDNSTTLTYPGSKYREPF